MRTSTKTQFAWVGQFIGFVPGKKSPYQYLAMQVISAVENSTETLDTFPAQQQVKLGSSLRRMMMGYLESQDWIRIVGTAKLDAQTGEMLWKAGEIVKISAQQASELMRKATVQTASSSAINSATEKRSKPTRILICQKSSCRQRGSQAVGDAIARTLKSNGQSAQVHIQPTGCMKQCQAGPHLVLIPAKQSQQKVTTTKYTHVTPTAATEIIETIL